MMMLTTMMMVLAGMTTTIMQILVKENTCAHLHKFYAFYNCTQILPKFTLIFAPDACVPAHLRARARERPVRARP